MSPRSDLKYLLIALFEHSGKKRFSFFARSLIAKLKSPDLSFDWVDNLSRRFNLFFLCSLATHFYTRFSRSFRSRRTTSDYRFTWAIGISTINLFFQGLHWLTMAVHLIGVSFNLRLLLSCFKDKQRNIFLEKCRPIMVFQCVLQLTVLAMNANRTGKMFNYFDGK